MAGEKALTSPPPFIIDTSVAVKLAFRHRITVYDGCFLALTVLEGGKLVTADAKLIQHTGNQKALTLLSELNF